MITREELERDPCLNLIEELERKSLHYLDCYTRKVRHELEARARIEQLEAALRRLVVWEGTIEVAAPVLGGFLIALHDARAALGEKKDAS